MTTKKNETVDRLYELAKTCNTVVMRQVLSENTTDKKLVNRLDEKHGSNAFLIACEDSLLDMVQLLIEYKVNVNLRRKDESTGFMIAASYGHLPVLQLLHKTGAVDWHLVGPASETCLHIAAKNGHMNCVRFAVEQGVGIDLMNSHLETALTLALRFEHFEIATFLLECGAQINIRGVNLSTALLRAAFDGRMKTLEYILDHDGDMTIRNCNGESAFIIACKRNLLAVASLLLAHGASANEFDDCGKTSLMFACMCGKLTLAKYLLSDECRATVDAIDTRRYTALMFAVHNPRHLELVRFLCDSGANIGWTEREGRNALMLACRAGSFEIADLLISCGASPAQRDKNGLSAADYIDDISLRTAFVEKHRSFFPLETKSAEDTAEDG